MRKGMASKEEAIILPCYKALLRPHFECTVPFWAPVYIKHLRWESSNEINEGYLILQLILKNRGLRGNLYLSKPLVPIYDACLLYIFLRSFCLSAFS